MWRSVPQGDFLRAFREAGLHPIPWFFCWFWRFSDADQRANALRLAAHMLRLRR